MDEHEGLPIVFEDSAYWQREDVGFRDSRKVDSHKHPRFQQSFAIVGRRPHGYRAGRFIHDFTGVEDLGIERAIWPCFIA